MRPETKEFLTKLRDLLYENEAEIKFYDSNPYEVETEYGIIIEVFEEKIKFPLQSQMSAWLIEKKLKL